MANWIKHNAEWILKTPERRLIDQVKHGNTGAFGKLYMKYLDALYRYIFFRVNQDVATAEDLTEMVFMKALKNIDTFQSGTNFRAWLYRIAGNIVVDYYRMHKSTVTVDSLANALASSENIERTFDLREEVGRVMRMLDELPSDQRLIISLKFIEELSNDEISEVTGKSHEAIRALQSRGLRTLRRRMDHA